MILSPPSRLGVSCEASLIVSLIVSLLVKLHKTFFSCLASQGDALLSYDQGPEKMASPFTFSLALPSIKGTPALRASNFLKCLAIFFVFFPMWVSCDIYITHLASGFTLHIFNQPRYVKLVGMFSQSSKKYFRCVAYLCSTLPSVYFMVLWSFVIFWWPFYILFSVVNMVGSPHDKSNAFKMQFNIVEWNVKALDERLHFVHYLKVNFVIT